MINTKKNIFNSIMENNQTSGKYDLLESLLGDPETVNEVILPNGGKHSIKPIVDKREFLLQQAMNLAKEGNVVGLNDMLRKYSFYIDINGVDEKGRNLAHYAAMSGNIEMLYAVQNAGVDMTAVDYIGNTIAHTAVQGRFSADTYEFEYPSVNFMQKIKDFGVDVTKPNAFGDTPLDIIAPVNHKGMRVVSDENKNTLKLTYYLTTLESARNILDRYADKFETKDYLNNKKANNSAMKNVLRKSVQLTAPVFNDVFETIQNGNNCER